jgi:hypothetical protein
VKKHSYIFRITVAPSFFNVGRYVGTFRLWHNMYITPWVDQRYPQQPALLLTSLKNMHKGRKETTCGEGSRAGRKKPSLIMGERGHGSAQWHIEFDHLVFP